MNPFCRFLFDPALGLLLHPPPQWHIENSSGSFKTNFVYLKKNLQNNSRKMSKRRWVNVCSSLWRRDRSVSPPGLGHPPPPPLVSLPTSTGTTQILKTNNSVQTLSFLLWFMSHTLLLIPSVGRSTRPAGSPVRPSVGWVGLLWRVRGGLGGLQGLRGQVGAPLLCRLAHRHEAAAFGGVRRGGAAVFEDAEPLV